MSETLEAFGHTEKVSKKILIVGGGNIGFNLAKNIEENLDAARVKIIEKNKERAEFLASELNNTIVINGDALDEEILKEANKLAKKIGDLVLEFKLKTGSDEKVFGSITTSQISKMLEEKGIEIHKRNISILSKVNSIGEYDVDLKIHKDLTHPIKINVTGDVVKTKKKKKAAKKEDTPKDETNDVKASSENVSDNKSSTDSKEEVETKKEAKDSKK